MIASVGSRVTVPTVESNEFPTSLLLAGNKPGCGSEAADPDLAGRLDDRQRRRA
jgi:hypothetical protein